MSHSKKRNQRERSSSATAVSQPAENAALSRTTKANFWLVAIVAFLVAIIIGISMSMTWRGVAASSAISAGPALASHFFNMPYIKKRGKAYIWCISSGAVLGLIAAGLLNAGGWHISRDGVKDMTTDSINDSFNPHILDNRESYSGEIEDGSKDDLIIIDGGNVGNDIDILDPATILNASHNVPAEEKITPSEDTNDLVTVIDDDLIISLPEHTATNKSLCSSIIIDTIKNVLGTDSQPADSIINGNVEFTKRTSEANSIESSESGTTFANLRKIVQLREEANEVISTSGIRNLLSNDYHRMARAYKQQEQWQQSYLYYLKSISMQMQCLRLHQAVDDAFFKKVYEIALLYQCIGDIPVIDTDHRNEAYYLSACLFEVASRYTYEERNEELGFLSSYYAGMINHKKLLFALEANDAQARQYAVDALAYYEKSLSYENYKKQKAFQYQYLYQICELSKKCINRFSRLPEMLSWNGYEEKAQYYKKLSR